MTRKSKNLRRGLLAFAFASVFLVSFGMISHNAFADLLATTPTIQTSLGMGASPDSDVVFLNEVGCFNSLIAKGEFAQMWHSCLHRP